MHELPITQNILAIAERHGRHAGATRITDLYLVIGQLSAVVDESVQFYWDIVSRDTLCAGAALHFERVPARLRCQDCGCDYGLEGELMACPRCDSIQVTITAGQEFQLRSIEIETGAQEAPA